MIRNGDVLWGVFQTMDCKNQPEDQDEENCTPFMYSGIFKTEERAVKEARKMSEDSFVAPLTVGAMDSMIEEEQDWPESWYPCLENKDGSEFTRLEYLKIKIENGRGTPEDKIELGELLCEKESEEV